MRMASAKTNRLCGLTCDPAWVWQSMALTIPHPIMGLVWADTMRMQATVGTRRRPISLSMQRRPPRRFWVRWALVP